MPAPTKAPCRLSRTRREQTPVEKQKQRASLPNMSPEPSPSKHHGVSPAPHGPRFRQDKLWAHSPSMQPTGGTQLESTRGSSWRALVVKTEVSCPTKPLKSHFLICPLAMPAGRDWEVTFLPLKSHLLSTNITMLRRAKQPSDI